MSAPKLYLLTSDDDITTLCDKLVRVFDTGIVSLLQIRRQHTVHAYDLITLYQETEILISLADKYNIPTVINENLELACHFNAGLHLASTGSIRLARELLGHDVFIGRSCYDDVAVFKEAKKEGASYGTMGAMFGTISKPLTKLASPQTLQRASQVDLPLCLVGGISLSNLDTLRQSIGDVSVEYLAITTDILQHSTDTISEKCRAWRDYLEHW